MSRLTWTMLFFYGNVAILIIVFLFLVNKRTLQILIPIGLFIAVENYTLELIGTHLGYWHYPLENPGFPEVTIISSLVYFPIIAMLYYQYLGNNLTKNILLTSVFLIFNMVTEVITLYTTDLFVYGKGMNLFWALLFYLSAYILIVMFANTYKNIKGKGMWYK